MKIKLNTEKKIYELYRGKKLIDTGNSVQEIERKYKMVVYFYDGTYSHLHKRK